MNCRACEFLDGTVCIMSGLDIDPDDPEICPEAELDRLEMMRDSMREERGMYADL